jgi:predicted ester cyclase
MSLEENKAVVRRFVDELNQGNLEIIDECVSRDFFNYSPPAGAETAPEVIRPLVSDVLTAFPDFKLDVSDFVDEGDVVTFRLTMDGTHSNSLWGAPSTGKHTSWTSTVTGRFSDGKFAFSWEDLPVPALLGLLRGIGMVPPPEDMDKPPKYPISVPEFLIKLIFTGQAADKPCSHLKLIQVIEPTTDVCNDCVALGDTWPALRMCLICGYVGCCDTSKNKHMKQHYEKTGHPIFRSIRLEERWVWCYEDDACFTGRVLEQHR